MSAKKMKILKKEAKQNGIPFTMAKRAYKTLSSDKRAAFKGDHGK